MVRLLTLWGVLLSLFWGSSLSAQESPQKTPDSKKAEKKLSQEQQINEKVLRLLENLKQNKSTEKSVQELLQMGDKAVSGLAGALTSKDTQIRVLAANLLVRFGKKALPALLQLIRALEDENFMVRGACAYALSQLGPQAKSAVPALLKRLDREKHWRVRALIISALGTLGRDQAEKIVPKLIEVLKQKEHPAVHYYSAFALGELGEASVEALPLLIDLLFQYRENFQLLSAPLQALKKICQSEKALPYLQKALQDEKKQPIWSYLLICATELGPKAAPLVPLLRKLCKNSDWEVRANSVYLLGTLGPLAKSAQGEIESLLSDSQVRVRPFAIFAAAKVGVQTEKALKAIRKALKEERTKYVAAFALFLLEGDKPEYRQILLEGIDKEPLRLSTQDVHTFSLLGHLGPKANFALAKLKEALKKKMHPRWKKLLEQTVKAVESK